MVKSAYRKRNLKFRSKRNFKKKAYAKRVPRVGLSTSIHRFVRFYDVSTEHLNIAASAGDHYFGKAYTFQLNQLPDYSDFTTLYDSYAITGVKLYLCFNGSQTPMYDTFFTVSPPEVLWHVDYDDAVPPTSNVAGWHAMQQAKCKFLTLGHRGINRFSAFIRPKILGMAYETSITTAYVPMKRTYIDMSNTDVPHYGFKYIVKCPHVAATGHDTNLDISVVAKMYITCKHPR